MKKEKINGILYYITLICILLIVLVFLSGCSKEEEKDINQKVEEELHYIDNKLVSMLNGLNNIHDTGRVLIKEEKTSNKESSESGGDSSSNNSREESSSSQSSSSESSKDQNSQSEENYKQYTLKENGVLTSEEKEIDWDNMKNTIESLYTTWITVLVDLHSLQVNNQDILDFSTTMDQTIIVIKQENKQETLNALVRLYSFLPKFTEQYAKDPDRTNLYYTKYYILNSYVLVEQDKWSEMQANITKAQEYFLNLINKVNENEQKQSKLNKIYVLINELNSAISMQDKDIYYIKYKNLMESISYIS